MTGKGSNTTLLIICIEILFYVKLQTHACLTTCYETWKIKVKTPLLLIYRNFLFILFI